MFHLIWMILCLYLHRNFKQKLQSEGIENWIYTTSFRTEKYIRHLFGHYGIKVGQIINGSRHMKQVQAWKKEPMPSNFRCKGGHK